MLKNPEVTVVVPCYNCEKTIERAFKSIIEQTHSPKQIILIDDCSTDNTPEVLSKLVAPGSVDLTIIKLTANAGPANARNIGINASANELVAFLDADDTWHQDKLALQLRVMIENPRCTLSGHHIGYNDGDHQVRTRNTYRNCRITFRRLLFRNYFNTPSVIIRKGTLRFPSDYRFAEDFYFWLSIAHEGGELIYIDATLGYVHKPFYGHSGLSSALSLMHKFEISALSAQLSENLLGNILVFTAMAFAKIKYIVRLLRTAGKAEHND